MTKVTLNNVGSLIDATTAATAINNNFDTIETAFDNTLSRDGTAPNTMRASLDMNSNNIINLPAATTTGEPVTFEVFEAALIGQGNLPSGGTTNQVLTKTSNTDFAVGWSSTINGVTLDNNAWTIYNPSFASSTGTAITSGRYKRIGKSCFYSVSFTFTSAITGNISVGLPFAATSLSVQGVAGRELVTSGKIVAGDISAGSSVIENIRFYDNTLPSASTSSFAINGVYEVA